jgi:hypothetical protein
VKEIPASLITRLITEAEQTAQRLGHELLANTVMRIKFVPLFSDGKLTGEWRGVCWDCGDVGIVAPRSFDKPRLRGALLTLRCKYAD